MNRHARYVNNTLSLRTPQSESLEIFEKICDMLSLKKDASLVEEITRVKTLCPTLTSFEREFPSICFALATGIGKTRLMGAFVAYLYYAKGIRDFFVMAPNLTIYNKLKSDFGNPGNPKYVFKGLDAFVNAPRIIDGDNYEEFRQGTFGYNDVVINVFNISKLNSESKTKDGKPARIKRLNEVLGESYFEYLKNLPDLCILMDESHHYHADRSFEVINELKPLLGIEVTATPQIQKGAKAIPFQNVVYEYSLAHALKDEKYIKVPAVFTRKDFRPEEYIPEELDKEKLKDGIKLHIDTKEVLVTYARTYRKPVIKPIVLVVARDTEHSKQIKEFLTSAEFYNGYYKDKVLEINSNQRGMEKDENIAQLLTLETPDNSIEIVVHVNMLKEGWDVNNLYTIIPLRTSASETLTEQTIGRGLRLPYGERTGNDKVDRLSIVSHDKYEAIIKLAEDPNSLVRRVYFIDPDESQKEDQKETVPMPSRYDELVYDHSYTDQLALFVAESADVPKETQNEIAKYVAAITNKSVMEMNKQVKNIKEISSPAMKNLLESSITSLTQREFSNLNLSKNDIAKVVEKAIESAVQALTNVVIPIPQAIIQPVVEKKPFFKSFSLDTRGMNWHPSNDTLVGTELHEDGRTFDLELADTYIKDSDTPENAILKHILVHENVDYEQCAELIFGLIDQLKAHFKSYLETDDEVNKVLVQRRKSIADNIYAQMNEHFYKEDVSYAATAMRPFSKIEVGFAGKYVSDDIFDYKANIPPQDIKSKIFKGFRKSCHSMYKFDSNTERIFAAVLENDNAVLKWMYPNIKQFIIYYDRDSNSQYKPDFVAETEGKIYMIEIKDSRKLEDEIVIKKAHAATEYCRAATEFNNVNGGKPWEYVLISHEEVKLNSSFDYLVKNAVKINRKAGILNEETIGLF